MGQNLSYLVRMPKYGHIVFCSANCYPILMRLRTSSHRLNVETNRYGTSHLASITSAAQHAQIKRHWNTSLPPRPALSHNRRRSASCLRRMPIIRRPTHGALRWTTGKLRERDYGPLFEDKNTILFGKLVKNIMKQNVSLKTSNKRTFSLSLLESESHSFIVTHFFRLLKLFLGIKTFKGKYFEKLKFLFLIFAYVMTLIY